MQSTFIPFQQNHSSPSSYSCSDSGGETPDWRLRKPFGAGLRCKRVKFVPASTSGDTPTAASSTRKKTGTEVANLYLSLVRLASPREQTAPSTTGTSTPVVVIEQAPETCLECSLPITDAYTHATSTAHQSSLPHSNPPHPYDRSSLGLKVLIDSGWDPDARVGLGKVGEGMRYPIKPVLKNDKLGIGIKPRKGEVAVKVVKKKMGAKEAAKKEREEGARRMELMGELGGGVDVEGILNAKMV